MTDLRKLGNPYDFANPVRDPNLFVGRASEIDEIKYYLDHAANASRPINLALIGQRASGKTSVLNMIELESQKRGFCVVRANLDEADAGSQLAFFYKIFDSTLTAACSLGAFGGLSGKTYDVYCDIVSTYETPNDSLFSPFVFPIRYAKSMSSGNINAPLPDTNFKRDVEAIQTEIGHPIVILFDECDVLSQSRIHLQKLRNIFMNTEGYMLVLTGTPALFPLIDEVFSPIVRQFKKIKIGPFEKRDDTEDCIKKPLSRIGLAPEEIFDFETYNDVREIHDLTGGRPYEINLLCHFLFRRVQEGRTPRMKLTLDVLDDVLEELRTTQDISVRPILNIVRDLDDESLAALGRLCQCNGRARFEQIWFSEYLYFEEESWTRSGLESKLQELIERGILALDDLGLISFKGDDFDRIYCKYLSRKHGGILPVNDLPFEIVLAGLRLDELLDNNGFGDSISDTELQFGKLSGTEFDHVVGLFADSSVGDIKGDNPFSVAFEIARQIYFASVENYDRSHFLLASVTITGPDTIVRRWFRCDTHDEAAKCMLESLPSLLEAPSRRANIMGGKLEVKIMESPIISVGILASKVKDAENLRLKEQFYMWHYEKMYEAYLEDDDLDRACVHGRLAYEYRPQPDIANNLGYLNLIRDNLEDAKSLMLFAIANYEEPFGLALTSYNLGVVECKSGDLLSAKTRFQAAITGCKELSESERSCAALVQLKVSESPAEITFLEIRQPDLLQTAEHALQVVSHFLPVRTETVEDPNK